MSTRGSGYQTDIVLAAFLRVILFSSICICAYTLGACSWRESIPSIPKMELGSEALSLSAERDSDKTRNYEPTKDGGCNEKSDRAPLRPMG